MYSYTRTPMRINPFLALLVVAIPTSLNAGFATNMSAIGDRTAMFSEQWRLVQEARRNHDYATLAGLLIPNGVSIASSDGSIPKVALEQAADAWNIALGARIVRVVNSVKDANMTVKLVNGIGDHHESQGDIEVFTTEGGVFSAEVLVDSQTGNRALSNREIGAVVTHEMGHFLGLDDLPGDNEIMGEFDPSHLVVRPSKEEADAIHTLQDAIRQVIRGTR